MEPIPNGPTKTLLRFGLWVSLALSIITFVTFGMALVAAPNPGTFCPGDCFEYPTWISFPNIRLILPGCTSTGAWSVIFNMGGLDASYYSKRDAII